MDTGIKKLLWREDRIDGIIYVCPHCHRYVMRDEGLQRCFKCGGAVDNDHTEQYKGRVKFDGLLPWK